MTEKSEQVAWLERLLKRPLHPSTSDSVLGWENRKCYQLDDDGNITGLNLTFCRISDGSFLTELTGLTSLALSDNQISDGSFLTELTGLTSLALSSNQITDGSFLKELTGLTSLDLSDNRISDWPFLTELTGLTSLDLSANAVSDGSFLTELTGLTSLALSYNRITDGSFLKELTGLTSLALRGNPISDGSFLTELTGLISLDLSANRISHGSFLKELTGLTSLALSHNRISDGSFLKELTGLTSLALSYNRISDWSCLTELTGLTSLALSPNPISDWSFLTELTGLTSLNLRDNPITDWRFLKELTGLTSLALSGNRIYDGSFLAELTGLTSLDLSYNRISDGSFLKELRGLTSLGLKDNRISDASFLTVLTGLTSLDLTRNQISEVGWMGRLTQLRTVSLKNNEVSELPKETLDLNVEIEANKRYSLVPQSINFDENPLKSPPLEIVEQGHAAIVSWFAALDEEERPLNEVKVILVGDGGAGKTSLRKRLMGEEADPEESKTHGIEIHDWRPKSGKKEILVHFWDFGGQEIMHATHQFFLSKRSLYILVLDGRKEEDAEYWLKHIESFGGDSPVLVVLNKMDEHPGFDVNRPALTEKYGSIRDFFRVACLKKRGGGIGELKKALLKQLGQVELARATWPGKWFNVKTRLEETNEHFIEYDEFTRICNKEGITDADTQRTLVQYLNDLGIALYFEDTWLKTTQVLEPRWVTQAVYRIINAPQLADGHGLLELGQLDEILEKTEEAHYAYPPDKHGYIVALMKKFELCYELEPDRILVPDLLEVKEPRFDFPDKDVLRFRFEYDFLPRSVLPRFIVNEHADIHNELRWRTGVVLRDPDTGARALVKADLRDRKITIEVAGDRRREYFASLRRTLRRIHDSFQKLRIDQFVPLPDHPDHALRYDDLIGHEEMGEEWIVVGSLRRKYRVKELLDGIETEADRQERRAESTVRDYLHKHSSERPMGNIELNIDGDLTVQGNLVVAKKIENSFNKAGAASSPDEIKTLLKQLAQEVAKVAQKLPDDKAEEVADDLQRLTEEVTKDTPKRKWWQLSADGIREAAQSAGDVGTTAISLLRELLPLLGS